MFESTPLNPPDAIFGLNEAFRNDPNPNKIDLTVGMYQDESGITPVLNCVATAKRQLVESNQNHAYLPIDGMPSFRRLVPNLVFGDGHIAVTDSLALSAQTPGGTGALRIAGDLLKGHYQVDRIWVSDPTWANHASIFQGARMETPAYAYLADDGKSLDFPAMLASLKQIPEQDAILLHTVCHNPTGIDLSTDQWHEVIGVIKQRRLLPVFDFAYQGFGENPEDDAWPIRQFCCDGAEAIVCSSFSKSFNLYGERVGAITAVAATNEQAVAVVSQIKKVIRTIYSNPPIFGAAVVAMVLESDALRGLWLDELEAMRLRIGQLRSQLAAALTERVPDTSFDHILSQRGMFSYSGISGEAADELKNRHSVYLLRSGRINVAGINSNNLQPFCDAVATVLAANTAAAK